MPICIHRLIKNIVGIVIEKSGMRFQKKWVEETVKATFY